MHPSFKRFVFTLGQMSTAVLLLLLLGGVSTLGTFLPQSVPPAVIEALYGPFLGQVFQFLGLNALYSAWWFLGVAGFLVVSVGVCLLSNGPRLWRQLKTPKAMPTLQFIKAAPLYIKTEKPKETITQSLRKAGFHCKYHQEGADGALTYWVRGTWGRIGYFITHIGVVLLSVGALFTGFFGYKLTLQLVEGAEYDYAARWNGEVFLHHQLPFTLSATQIDVPRYFTGMPKQFITRLSVQQKNKKVEEKILSVNSPVHIGPYRIYQADYGDGGSPISLFLRPLYSRAAAQTAHGRTAFDEIAFAENGTIITPIKLQPATILPASNAEEGKQKALQDFGPSLEVAVFSPTKGAQVLRLFLNMPWVIGLQPQPEGGNSVQEGVVDGFNLIFLGLDPTREEGWPLVRYLLQQAKLHPPYDEEGAQGFFIHTLKEGGHLFLAGLPEEARFRLALSALKAANTLYALGLDYAPALNAATFKPYSGVTLARDPGAFLFLFGGFLVFFGASALLLCPFARLWVLEDGKNATHLGAYSAKKNLFVVLWADLVNA